jgi:V/A-type H+-transporting ATPase subunit D
MAKLALNQRSLHFESTRLAAFQRFLPAVDLKRRQLIAERNIARQRLARLEQEVAALGAEVVASLPMLADLELDLARLVDVQRVDVAQENLLGAHLPVLREVIVQAVPVPLLGTPAWLGFAQDLMARAVARELELRIAAKRVECLDHAVRKATQRFNLFDKVLVPRSRAAIRRISLFLADQSRAAVVRAKIAKSRRVEGDR